jgi:uncharacterized small protein (DUF1192 family)
MSTENKPGFVRLTLTEDQKAHVRASTGLEAAAIELSVKELEERIAPLNFAKIMY